MRVRLRKKALRLVFMVMMILGTSILVMFCSGKKNLGTGQEESMEMSTGTGGPGKLTVFAADPEFGVYGMYREGDEYVFYHVKSVSDGEKVVPSVNFYDKNMNVIADSTNNSAAAFIPASKGITVSKLQQNLVSTAAYELQKNLEHEVFIHEKSVLVDFQDLTGKRSVNKAEIKALAEKVSPATRSIKTVDYFKGLQKDLSWKSDSKSNGIEIKGNYLGTEFHTNYMIFNDEMGTQGNPTLPRLERNARFTSSTGKNLVVQLGGHWIPEGYTIAPSEENHLGRKGISSTENLENHHQAIGEGFMAGRVINFKSDFPTQEKEVLAKIGTYLVTHVMPTKESQTLTKANTYRSWLQLAWKDIINGADDFHHSATLTNYFLNGSYRGGTYYCNHGGCWGDSDMHKDCIIDRYTTDKWNIPPYSTIPSHDVGSGGWHSCQSDYNLAPGSSYHVCNDDSWTQIRATKRLSYCITAGCGSRCGDIWTRPGYPSCND